jgi:hypothetical protein
VLLKRGFKWLFFCFCALQAASLELASSAANSNGTTGRHVCVRSCLVLQFELSVFQWLLARGWLNGWFVCSGIMKLRKGGSINNFVGTW